MIGGTLAHLCEFSFPFIAVYLSYILPRFLYTLFAAVDANFKLKGKERYLRDVELMPGLGAYIEEASFQAHIANYIDQPEVRARSNPLSCS